MNSEILNPEAPLTREDARMFERLARDKSWMGNIDADTRGKIVSKLLAGYARLKVDEGMSQEEIRLNMSILDRVARTFGLLDKVDAEREAAMLRERQAPGSTVNNTLNINGPAEMFREVITQLRNGNNAALRPEQAATEPAGDD